MVNSKCRKIPFAVAHRLNIEPDSELAKIEGAGSRNYPLYYFAK
jgi:hypothetical protein